MTEVTARSVLLVKAIEEHDTKAELLSHHLRRQATARAQAALREAGGLETAHPEELVSRRAALLAEHLQATQPAVAAILSGVSWRKWFTPTACLGALALGLATNALGPDRRISILAIPLLGMITWNLAVYLILMLGLLKRSRSPHAAPDLLVALTRRCALPNRGHIQTHDQDTSPLWRGLNAFSRDWLQRSMPLQLARAKCTLHAAAALLAVGAVAGMYWRGLAFEYRAGWESTFLDAEHVRALLKVFLGPASLLTGIDLPSISQLRAIRWPGSEGELAAPWIHLYAVTAGLVIGLPRLILAFWNRSHAARVEQRFPISLDNPYFQRLLTPNPPLLSDSAWILPCGLELHPRQTEALRAFLYELLGLNATLRFENSVHYGDEDEFLTRLPTSNLPNHVFPLFNMATTPEAESHGRLLDGLKAALSSTDRRVIPLLDESSYSRRLSGQIESQQQIENRRKTWQRLAREHGLPLVTLDLDSPNPDQWYDQLRQVLANSRESTRERNYDHHP